MAKTYLFCPIEQELLCDIELDEPCEYFGGECVECPHLIEVDEHGHEILG